MSLGVVEERAWIRAGLSKVSDKRDMEKGIYVILA